MTAIAMPPVAAPRGPRGHAHSRDATLSEQLHTRANEILARRPAVGLSVGVVRAGRPAFHVRGLADIRHKTPVTDDTVFRIGSISKTVTAVAVMQLVERGLIDLDAPANRYLRAVRLVGPGFRPPSVRHLLTHTAGIPDLRHVSELRYSGLTPEDGRPPLLNVEFGEPLPSLAEYYRNGLEVVSEPGRTFAYCNHGFVVLGQIIEDVSGEPLDRYFRDRIFEPLGMFDTDLVRSDRIAPRLATAYAFGRGGPRPLPDRDWIGGACGGLYSTIRDLARYATALVGGGANEHGSILKPTTLATMFDPQYQPDPRLVGMGLGFFRADIGGHRIVSHDGILPGFHSRLVVAPDDDIAVIGLTNGSPGAFSWLQVELDALLGHLLDVPAEPAGHQAPHHPEVWGQVCGRYVLPPRVSDLRERLVFGAGVEVMVRGGRLLVRILTPIPALLRGLPLEPDDATDPYVFRLDLSPIGMTPVRLVFADVVDGRATLALSDFGGQPWSFQRTQGAVTHAARRWTAGTLAVAGLLAVLRRWRASR